MVRFFAQAAHPRDALLFAVPNGEARAKQTAARLVGIPERLREHMSDDDALRPAGQGVLPGTADLVLLLPGGGCVLVEVKIPATPAVLPSLPLALGRTPPLHQAGRLARAQKRFRGGAQRLGHDYRVVRSLAEWAALLAEKGVPLRATVLGMEWTPPPSSH